VWRVSIYIYIYIHAWSILSSSASKEREDWTPEICEGKMKVKSIKCISSLSVYYLFSPSLPMLKVWIKISLGISSIEETSLVSSSTTFPIWKLISHSFLLLITRALSYNLQVKLISVCSLMKDFLEFNLSTSTSIILFPWTLCKRVIQSRNLNCHRLNKRWRYHSL